MIDVNVALGQYPFRRLPSDEPPRLAERLQKLGVTQAWTSSLEGLLHGDMAGVNSRLATLCREIADSFFLPVGVVHPGLPGWKEDVRRCVELHGMQGLRLFPAYHQYDFDRPEVAELLDLAQQHNVFLQILWRVEDERTEHPLIVPGKLTAAKLLPLIGDRPSLPIVLLNAHRDIKGEDIGRLIKAGNVSFDLASLEASAGIERWLQTHPAERLLFGTYAPAFVPESAVFKLQESELPLPIREAITQRNARHIRDREMPKAP